MFNRKIMNAVLDVLAEALIIMNVAVVAMIIIGIVTNQFDQTRLAITFLMGIFGRIIYRVYRSESEETFETTK